MIKNEESNRLKKAFNVKLVIARKQPSRLKSMSSHASFTSIPRVFKTTGNFKCSSVCRQNYMITGKYVFTSDGMRLYTLRHKFSCNVVNVVYQITCAGCKQRYIGETQDFRQRINLHKSDVRTLNTRLFSRPTY